MGTKGRGGRDRTLVMEDIAQNVKGNGVACLIAHARRSQTGLPGPSAAAFSRSDESRPIGSSLDLPSAG